MILLNGCSGIRSALPGSPQDAAPGLITAQDRAQIHALIALYSHTFDGGDVDAWIDLFTEEAEFVTSTVGSAQGKEALRRWAEERLADRAGDQMRHFATNTLLRPLSSDQVRARSYVLITRQSLTGGSLAQVLFTGVYEDDIRRTPKGWKFERRRAEASLPLDDAFRCAAGC
ncbi:MAG: nuclear transport factor 2 family protein [Myxococcota bacterium]